MRKIRQSTVLTLLVFCLGILPATAKSPTFPDLISLPTGFRPEGIALGRQTTFFTGSLADGDIYRGDLRTGEGDIFIEGETGQVSVGMAYDNRSDGLFVAGGPTGTARVYNATTGEQLAFYQLAAPGNFINDVVITNEAAFFTNSSQALLYRLPLDANGRLPDASEVEALTLSGAWQQVPGFNANGIEASADGRWLVIVNSTRGELYRVDPTSGEAVLINLGGQSVSNGDGLRFRGELLYVVRNRLNEIVVIYLNDDLSSGVKVASISNPNFQVPTTLAAFGDALYAVNAKFGIPSPATSPFEIVQVPIE